jgi:hypothetical protein
MAERYYPKEESLGENCLYWALGDTVAGCCFPKEELRGRKSCEGIIDDVCLFIKDGRKPTSLTDEQILEIKTRIPVVDQNSLPPGDT